MTALEEIKYRATQFAIGASSEQTILILEHLEKVERQNELLRNELFKAQAENRAMKAKLKHAMNMLEEHDPRPSRDDLVDMKNLYGV